MDKKTILRGVCVYASPSRLMITKGYRLYWCEYGDNGAERKPRYFSRLVDKKNSLLSRFKFTRRLFRAEITHMYRYGDTWFCIAKKGLFRYDEKSNLFEKCHHFEKGSRPMNLCEGTDGTLYYGEYCYNPQRNEMRIYQSKDKGDTWSVAYTFAKGDINHVHGIFADPYTDRLWVATGDDDKGCIFGYTTDGFKTFVKAYHGSQQNRVCVPLFTPDKIIFATDSQYEHNYIRSINRATGEVRTLQAIQGSGIYAAQFDGGYMVSTTVEPSAVNRDKSAHLWYSADGEEWHEKVSYPKDVLPKTYFQFGSLRFPTFGKGVKTIITTGRALSGLDGNTLIIP